MFLSLALVLAPSLVITPLKPSGIYDLREPAGWTVSLASGAPTGRYSYTLKENNAVVIKSGDLDLSNGKANLEVTLDHPAMLYLQIEEPDGPTLPFGAAVDPTGLRPDTVRPADFDAFWQSKIDGLERVPINSVLAPGDSGRPGIEFETVKLDSVDGSHVQGQLAKPRKPGKLPALLVLQWASPPYPLQKAWAVGPASQGWLTLNIEPHDVLPDGPPSYYASLPSELKNYQAIGQDDRDKSYFLRMYLADYRAIDYLASRPDWDGKTLVVMGGSMGGQQALCVAGLHPKVTHVIVEEPAGCDLNAPLHGRSIGYPFFSPKDAKAMETARYFDAVNFAPRIHVPSLVAMGFVDTVCPPAGVWTALNQIRAPKLAVPLRDAPHNNTATQAEQRPYFQDSQAWLDTLVRGGRIDPRSTPYDDHRNMMEQLGLRAIRPGPDPNNQSTFDEETANPYKNSMPDVLTMNDGARVSSAAQWPKRRAQILEDFEREVYGRIPRNTPKVDWEVTGVTPGLSGGIPIVTKTLVGHVDNRACPSISVDIQANFTVPDHAVKPVPIMIEFGFGPGFRFPRRPGTVPWTDQAIARGWGYGTIVPTSVQPDNDQLRSGIIGLCNRGKPRKPDDWGALRAWQWGFSKLIDYFQSAKDSMVDATKVGVEGLSRYGKAAIVTEAFDPRVAVGLIGSSGEGGVKLHRHIYGEAVENLAGGEYYWMAGSFMKYGASDPAKTAADLPVDSHELIALCAPRPCFISYGVVERGDAKWVDAHGSFMAAVLAGPVYRLLGKQDLGTPGNYLTDQMPPVNQLIGGDLAWRQHDGGHDVTPNWPSFFEWVGHYIQAPPLPEEKTPVHLAADLPSPRTDQNSELAHQQLLDKAYSGGIDVYFVGDSITRRWGCTDPQYRDLLENWTANFHGWNAGNFGWGGDTTQNILWRLRNGELDGVNPKVIVVLAGTNNVGSGASVDDVTRGVKAIVAECRRRAPGSKIVLTAIFPRNDEMGFLPKIEAINHNLAGLAEGAHVRFLDVNGKLADQNGRLFEGMMKPDGLHPAVKGYQLWAEGLKPILTEWLGPQAKEDHAPPPTGDPSVTAR